jgi:3'-phosphoadenosine 5'-phosphosulfate (PAPS) 3'-phosphatase
MRFGIPLSELLIKSNRTNEEEEFVKWYFIKMPLSISKSVMNKICWLVEGEFDNLKSNSYSNDFDYSILMSDKPYTKGRYNAIKKLYSDYNKTLKEQSQIFSLKKVDKEERKTLRKMFKHQFKIKASELCSDAEELCNIVIKLCYNNNNSKQFAWDVCGDTIIQNLLKNNEYKVSYPVPDSMGDIVFDGERFSMITEEVVNEDNIR